MRLKFNRFFLLLFSVAFPGFAACAQHWETVKQGDAYIWGEGWGSTLAEADSRAVADLISKISMHVSGTSEQSEHERLSSDGVDSNGSFISTISTYSSATLTNTQKVILENEPDAHVGRWMKRSELAKVFESRKNKIRDYISSAVKAESRGKADVALKDYYWALALTRTLQNSSDFMYDDGEGERWLVVNEIPRRINAIFADLKACPGIRKGDELEMHFTYKGKPVPSLDFTYFDGRDWSNLSSAKDGIGVLEFPPDTEQQSCRIKFEYEYRGESHIDPEVESVLKASPSVPMRSAYVNVDLKTGDKSFSPVLGSDHLKNSFSSVSPEIYSLPETVSKDSRSRSVIEKFARSISTRTYDMPEEMFAPGVKDVYDRLVQYGRARLAGTPEYKFYKQGENVIIRGLQLAFSFKTGIRRNFVEDVVVTLQPDGLISNISFGLGKTAEADILGKGVWSQEARFAIMNFLENYQTAYALKRLDYISSVFDDDAVIITGSVVKSPMRRTSNGDVSGISFGGDIVKYNRHTKDSYLKHLARSFASKEYINLRFADNEVRKLGKGGELYAIQISQEYYSSNYGDKGYLFLMVDINEPENPLIKVRTWQPEKDPQFGIYGPEHFK